MSDDQNLIKEVDEEVRQDDYKRIWNRYKKYIFIELIVLLKTYLFTYTSSLFIFSITSGSISK